MNELRIKAKELRFKKYQELKEMNKEELNLIEKGMLKKYKEEFKEPRYGTK